MGKIKMRTIGDESMENKQKEQSKIKAHEKKLVKGGKGGERIVAVGPSEAEIAKIQLPTEGTVEDKIKANEDYKVTF